MTEKGDVSDGLELKPCKVDDANFTGRRQSSEFRARHFFEIPKMKRKDSGYCRANDFGLHISDTRKDMSGVKISALLPPHGPVDRGSASHEQVIVVLRDSDRHFW